MVVVREIGRLTGVSRASEPGSLLAGDKGYEYKYRRELPSLRVFFLARAHGATAHVHQLGIILSENKDSLSRCPWEVCNSGRTRQERNVRGMPYSDPGFGLAHPRTTLHKRRPQTYTSRS